MPTYSPRKGVTTGVGHKNGKVYIKMVDENHPDGYTETKVMAEEVKTVTLLLLVMQIRSEP